MKAMLTDDQQNLCWTDVPDPVCRPDEVLVKIHAAALNRADLLQRQGKYPSPPGCPPWMGLEIAGEIVKVGQGQSEHYCHHHADHPGVSFHTAPPFCYP